MKKYKKQNNIDLSDRINIQIVKSDDKFVSDSDIEAFREQLNTRSKITDDFCKYYIEKQVETQKELSEEEFSKTMKELKKQHKILRCLLKEEDIS